MYCLSRQAQVFDAGAATKRALGEHVRREIKCLGRDGREIELLADLCWLLRASVRKNGA